MTEPNHRFRRLLDIAEKYFSDGDAAGAARLAQVAAYYAFRGRWSFASPRLENLLIRIGRQISNPSPISYSGPQQQQLRVLHILTHARPVGGDSRFAWRWIQRDAANQHSIVITNQEAVSGIYEIPPIMLEAARGSGGYVRTLGAPSSLPLEQARELRSLCQAADVAVLHLFPYDVIPVLALAAGCEKVKTLFINHADHTLWIGASVAHTIVHLRSQNDEFLRKRRGLEPEHSSILPIPLIHSPLSLSRTEARRRLGFGPRDVVLLTIAGPFKYSSPGHIGFIELITPVMIRLPQAKLIAVGPEPSETWRNANMRTNGRIVALGERYQTDLFYAAADVYLDSIPFSSITSLLEAGSHGIPLLGLRPASPALTLLGPGAPGIDNIMEVADTASNYRVTLAHLIEDADFRHQKGQLIREKILYAHAGLGWMDALREVYAKVYRTPERKCLVATSDSFECDEMNAALLRLYSSVPYSVRSLVRHYVGTLPYRSRLSITCQLSRAGFAMSWLNLLPSPIDTVLHKSARKAKSVLKQRMLKVAFST